MKPRTKLLLGGGIVVTGGVIAYVLYKAFAKQPSIVSLSYDESLGQVSINDQALSPDDYEFSIGDVLTVTATPNSGNYFLGWLVDGATLGTDLTITLKISQPIHVISALFSATPPDGNGTHIPSTIYSLNSPVSITQKVMCRVDQGLWSYKLTNKYCLDDWITEGLTVSQVVFKVEDSAGNGVPNIPINLWSNDMPDNNDNRAAGGAILYFLLPDGPKSFEGPNPGTIYTLADGYAQIFLLYMPVDFKRFVGQHYHVCNILGNCGCCAQEEEVVSGRVGARSIKYFCPGGETVPDNHLLLPVVNTVYAKVKDTVLLSQAVIQCALDIREL